MGKLNVAVSTILITAMVSTLIGINPTSIWSDQQETFAGLSIENTVSIPDPDNLLDDLKPFEYAAESPSKPPVTTQEDDPAWLDVKAPLVSPADAHKVLDTVSEANTEVMAVAETEVSTEIAELARGLQYDPELVYLYVHNYIDYVPIYGSIKGATMTLIDGQGSDFDQTSLFIALMQASGYDARYVYGNITYPVDVIVNWLGVEGEIGPLGQLLGSGGIPGIIWWSGSSDNVVAVTMDRVWAVVDIGGTDYVFDPSFKQYDTSPKLELEPILGYNQTTFLSLAEDGAIIDPDYTQGLNEPNIRDALTGYSMNLHSYLETNLPNGSLEDVLGGREIIPEEVMPLETSLPYDSAVLYEWSEIPDNYRHHFRVQHEGIDHTFATHEIYGKRLSIFYNYFDEPELRLDGDLIATGWWCYPGYYYYITLTVDHPYAAIGGTYGDQTYTRYILAGGQCVITSNFGGTTEKVIAPRNLLLSENMHAGLASDSEPVRGETLHIMGLTYHAECGRAGELAGKISDTVVVTHHVVGLLECTASYSIDIPMAFRSFTSINDNQELEDACFRATIGISSAFEHGMISQLQDVDAISTVRLIQLANEAGDKIFDANPSNWDDIWPQLENYTSQQLGYLNVTISNNNCTITLPQDGAITSGNWSGAGFIVHWPSGGKGYIIWGGIYGGSPPGKGPPDSDIVDRETDPSKPGDDNLSAEPVNLASGAYVYTHTDLTLGRRGNPNGLAFARYYNSGSRLGNSTLGYGWDHSYNIYLNVNSDGYRGMGADSHFDAVGAVAELYVTIDLMRGSFSHEKTVVATIAHKWFADQLIDNAVKLNSGGQVSEFIRLPDGSYNPPPGITDELVYNAGNSTYSLNRRFGIVLDFNTEGQIEAWTDANGNAMQFLYDGDGLLDTLTDAFDRTLAFSYNADKRLESVTDSTDRVIAFSYDGDGNLDAYTDPTGIATYQYSYDSGHRMTEIHAPSGQRLVTNVYDTLDRVMEQTNGRNFTWEFFWSGYRNVERDPLGNEHVYYFDDRARLVAETDRCGATTESTYDGQNHRTSVTDANNHTTQFAYDEDNNLASFISALSNIIAFSYDGEDRLKAVTDPSGNTTSFSYDSNHNLLSITDPLGNSANYTYDSRGRVESSTDANGYISTFTYDSADNFESAADPLEYTTDFTYDGVGNLLSVTDANSNNTSFTYDNNRQMTGVTDASGNSTAYTYDLDGNLESRTDGNGDTTLYGYDENWNLTTITYPEYSVVLTYDELDNMTQVTDPAGISTYDYDEEGRFTSYTDVNSYAVYYSYDLVGNTLSITYPGSKTASYSYDADNELDSVNDWLGGTTEYGCDSRGLLTFTILPNGAKVEHQYDEAGRMIGLSNTDSTDAVIASYSYTLDPNGNILSQTTSQPLMPVPLPGSTNYTYGPDNRLISAGGTSFLYDKNGNLIQKGNTTYAYDYENRLVEVATPSDTWEYTYDGLGNRIGVNHNGEEHWYLLDPQEITQVLLEYDGNGITDYYVYGLGLISIVNVADDPYYYHYDHIGNTVAMTDETESIVNTYAYTPFGKVAGIQETLTNPFRYVGQFGVIDDRNGLLYMRARYYDTEASRFITKDPIGFTGGLNLYDYVAGNPIVYVDPLGLHREKLWWEKLEEGYYYGTGFGQEALDWWASKWAETGNPLYGVGGFFAALWTPQTYQDTAWTLISAYGIRNAGSTWYMRDHTPGTTVIDYGRIFRLEKHMIGKGAAHSMKWHIDAFGKLIRHWPWGI